MHVPHPPMAKVWDGCIVCSEEAGTADIQRVSKQNVQNVATERVFKTTSPKDIYVWTSLGARIMNNKYIYT